MEYWDSYSHFIVLWYFMVLCTVMHKCSYDKYVQKEKCYGNYVLGEIGGLESILIYGKGKTSKPISSSLRNNSRLSLESNSTMLSIACRLGNTSPMRRNRIGAQPSRHCAKAWRRDRGMANSLERRAPRVRKETLENEHNAKTLEELADEDTGGMEPW